MTHTPLPWKLKLGFAAPEIIGETRRIAMVLYEGGSEDREVDDNAEFIVRACNSHAELLKALDAVANAHAYTGWVDEKTIEQVEQAIARATKGSDEQIDNS